MKKDRACRGCRNLQKRVDFLSAAIEASELEWFERGKELERINRAVSAWDVHMPADLYAQLRTILDGYIERCTTKGATGTRKYRRRPKG